MSNTFLKVTATIGLCAVIGSLWMVALNFGGVDTGIHPFNYFDIQMIFLAGTVVYLASESFLKKFNAIFTACLLITLASILTFMLPSLTKLTDDYGHHVPQGGYLLDAILFWLLISAIFLPFWSIAELIALWKD